MDTLENKVRRIYQILFHCQEMLYDLGMDTLAGNIASSLGEELKWNKWIAEPVKPEENV